MSYIINGSMFVREKKNYLYFPKTALYLVKKIWFCPVCDIFSIHWKFNYFESWKEPDRSMSMNIVTSGIKLNIIKVSTCIMVSDYVREKKSIPKPKYNNSLSMFYIVKYIFLWVFYFNIEQIAY